VSSGIDPVVGACLRAGLALLFAAAAWHKLGRVREFRAALAAYRLLPGRAVPAAAAALAAAEVAVALALLLPSLGAAGPIGAAALLLFYAGAIAVNLLRGRREIDCGCGGIAGAQPIAWGLVLRNAALSAAAAACALPLARRPLVWVDAISLVGGVAALALLYAAGDLALAHGRRLGALRSRP
jgi:hypothetical protein